MMFENAGMVPNAANPYQDDSSQRMPVREITEDVVLTVRDIDRLVQAKLADAARDAAHTQRVACMDAWERGRRRGIDEQRERDDGEVRAEVEKVIGGFIHVESGLQRIEDGPKSIAADRSRIGLQRVQLSRAIEALRVAVKRGVRP